MKKKKKRSKKEDIKKENSENLEKENQLLKNNPNMKNDESLQNITIELSKNSFDFNSENLESFSEKSEDIKNGKFKH